MMPSAATLKLIGYGLAALAVIALLAVVNGWRVQAKDRGEKLAVICQSVRDASGQPKLKCGDVAKQVKFMGEAIGSLSNAIARQNAVLAAQGAETKHQQQIAAQASQDAARRAKAPERVSQGLEASSRAPERSSAPCEPSKALKEAWR